MPLHRSSPDLPRALRLLPLLLGLAAAHAADPTPPSASTLKLETNPEIAAGKIAIVQSEVGAEPDRYIVENLTILQPVQVVVVTKKAGDSVKVQLSKHRWDQVEQEAITGATGAATFMFRTEGDLKITVTAPDGACRYQLAVWAGDALKPPMQSPFVSMAAFKKTSPAAGGLGSSPVLWVIAALLGLVVVLLFVLVLKKKNP